ncbi:unnamed protein product [Pieris macdunnoughi]|uniref:Uncharacterized protein n=1 Tax=Pieris macdunnoughi TaxID=345717 RepID=A0A821TRY4_9NEOP|nr:unnamed protein product [Pieris macdunnoughi]
MREKTLNVIETFQREPHSVTKAKIRQSSDVSLDLGPCDMAQPQADVTNTNSTFAERPLGARRLAPVATTRSLCTLTHNIKKKKLYADTGTSLCKILLNLQWD